MFSLQHFSTNSFFKNDVITKEFHLSDGGEPTSRATKIEWNTGKNLVEKSRSKDNADGTTGKKRGHDEGMESFFAWFSESSDPNMDELGEVIKDDIWPNPLQYYLASDMDDGVGKLSMSCAFMNDVNIITTTCVDTRQFGIRYIQIVIHSNSNCGSHSENSFAGEDEEEEEIDDEEDEEVSSG